MQVSRVLIVRTFLCLCKRFLFLSVSVCLSVCVFCLSFVRI